jgi:hypothetical protein
MQLQTMTERRERPDVSPEQRVAAKLVKRIRKLRWIGMEEEAEQLQIACPELALRFVCSPSRKIRIDLRAAFTKRISGRSHAPLGGRNLREPCRRRFGLAGPAKEQQSCD